MTRIAQLRNRLAAPGGFVLPTVMLALLIITLLVSAAVIATVSSSGLALRDANAKRAEQAADAGLRMAAFEYDISALDLFSISTLQGQVGNCVTGSTSTGISVITKSTSATTPWCDAVLEDLGNGEAYSYQSSPATQILHQTSVTPTGCTLNLLGVQVCTGPDIVTYSTELERIIVSTGTAGSVTRRVAERISLLGTATIETCTGVVGCLLDLVMTTLGGTVGGPGVATGSTITQSYAVEPNSYRQCPATAPSGSDPSSNCSLGPTGIS